MSERSGRIVIAMLTLVSMTMAVAVLTEQVASAAVPRALVATATASGSVTDRKSVV